MSDPVKSDHLELIQDIEDMYSSRITGVESDFLFGAPGSSYPSAKEILENGRHLSDKQAHWLEGIYDRVTG